MLLRSSSATSITGVSNITSDRVITTSSTDMTSDNWIGPIHAPRRTVLGGGTVSTITSSNTRVSSITTDGRVSNTSTISTSSTDMTSDTIDNSTTNDSTISTDITDNTIVSTGWWWEIN